MVRGGDRVRVPYQGIAVRLLRGDVLVADGAARAGTVHDQHTLVEIARHSIGEDACGDVGRGAGWEEDGDFQRGTLRERRFLRMNDERSERSDQSEKHPHFSTSSI